MSETNITNEIIRKFEPILNQLNLVELTVLNRMVVDRIRLVHKAGALMYMSKLNIGDHVSWDGSDGVVHTGIIIRLNQKTASVKTTADGYWKVSPGLLRKEV
jgi:hypothetical protein